MEKETIVVFDFDGTLTQKDTFIEFARHAVGKRGLLFGILKNFPWLTAWKLKLLDGGKAKQRLFSSLFKGMAFSEFQKYCREFASVIKSFERRNVVDKLHYHLNAGHKVYIISASIPDWIIPWAEDHGVAKGIILGTAIEIDGMGRLTGRFSTHNCNGKEKVRRLKEQEPNLANSQLYAYGDSSGDKPLLAIADHSEFIK